MGGFWANRWNIAEIFFIYTFFLSNSPTGQTVHHIFTLNGSNDADSRKGVLFLAFADIAPHFGDQIAPKTPIFGTWIGIFQPNASNIEMFMLKCYEMLCVWALQTPSANNISQIWISKMAAAAILKNRKTLISSQPIDRFWQNFALFWLLGYRGSRRVCISILCILITKKI